MEDISVDAPSGTNERQQQRTNNPTTCSGAGEDSSNNGSTSTSKPSSSQLLDKLASSSSSLLSGMSVDPSDTLSSKVQQIAQSMASFAKDTSTIVSKEEIESCDDIETLRQKCTQLFKSREMMQIQLRIMDLQRTMEIEGSNKQQEEVNAQADAARKEEIYKQVIVVLESEFSCSICSDIYIQPTVVGCGHTFCNFCIMQWKREKFDCPICRKWLREESKHVEMENFVNKLYTLFSSEVRERRQQVIRDRQEAIIQTAASRAAAAAAPPPTPSVPPMPGIAREDIEAWRTADRTYRTQLYARRAEMYESLRRRRVALRDVHGVAPFIEPRGIDGDPEVILSRRAAATAAYIRRETENRAARRMRELASSGPSQSSGTGQSSSPSVAVGGTARCTVPPMVVGAPRTHRLFQVGPYERLHRHPHHRHPTSGRITVIGRPDSATPSSGSTGVSVTPVSSRPSPLQIVTESIDGARGGTLAAGYMNYGIPGSYGSPYLAPPPERFERRRTETTESDRRASILNSTARILETAENATNVDRAVARILRRQVANENTFLADTAQGATGGGSSGVAGSGSSQQGGSQGPPLLPPPIPVSVIRNDSFEPNMDSELNRHRVGIIVEDHNGNGSGDGAQFVFADMEVLGRIGMEPPASQPEQPRDGGEGSGQEQQSDDVLFLGSVGCRMLGQFRHGASGAHQPIQGTSSSASTPSTLAPPHSVEDMESLNDMLPEDLPSENPSADRTNPNDDSDLSSMDEDYDPLL